MGSMIVLSDGRDWRAGGALFSWVVEFAARVISEPEVAVELKNIVENNFGFWDLGQLPADVRDRVEVHLRDHLVEAGVRELPDSEFKKYAVEELRELARMF